MVGSRIEQVEIESEYKVCKIDIDLRHLEEYTEELNRPELTKVVKEMREKLELIKNSPFGKIECDREGRPIWK